MRKIYIRLLLLLGFFGACGALVARDTHLIRGVVLDEELAEPLIGATILIKGTNTGTVSDFDGGFAIKVAGEGVTLVVSYTGFMTKEVVLELPYPPQRIEIKLEEEVPVELIVYGPGYPMVSKEAYPAPGYYPHPALALRGQVPGLLVAQAGNDPWEVPQVRALGIHTLFQNAQPIWDIEGLPGADPLLYDGMGLTEVEHLYRPVDLLPYGLQAGSGVLRAAVDEPQEPRGWQHHYRTQLTHASPQRLPEVAGAEAYRSRWAGRPDLGFATDWLREVTRNSWSHDHHWQTLYSDKYWQVRGDLNYRNAQGVGRNSQWQQLGGRLLLARTFYADKLKLEVQAIGNRRWGERDYHQTFFQAAKYNPTAPIRFTERPEGNVFLEGMYEFGQNSLNNFFEVVSSVDIFNPVAMQTSSHLLETRTHQAAQASLNWAFSRYGKLELRAATQANDQIAGEENSINAYFRGNATTLRPGAAGRWAWERRQEFVQAKLQYDWKMRKAKLRTEGGYRFQRFRFGNDNSRGLGFVDNDFTYENFALRLRQDGELFQYQSAETHRLIDFLAKADYTHDIGVNWRTALLYQGSTRLGPDHRWLPLAATDVELQMGKILDVSKLHDLYVQAGYALVGGLPQNEEAYQGQYNPGTTLPRTDNSKLRPEQRRLFNLGLIWKGYDLHFELQYQHSQTRNLIASELRMPEPAVSEAVGINLDQAKLVNGSLRGRLVYRRSIHSLIWRTELSGMYVRTELQATGEAGPGGYFNDRGYYVVETANLRGQNGGLGIAVLRLGEAYGQLLGRQLELEATRAAGQFVTAEQFAGNALVAASAYGIVGNGLPTTSWSWRNRLSGRNWAIDFQFRADLGYDLAHLRRGELDYTIPQDVIFPASRNYLSTPYDLEGVAGFPVFTDYYVEQADYLSLDYVSFSYDILRKHRPFCTLTLTAQNLALWTNYTGVDPSPRLVDTGLEWNGSNSVLGSAGQLAPGVDRRAFYPRARMVSLGVEVSL